ncbi:MAG: hypothetical protein ACE37D_18180 [Pseudomonadales bacterium]
MDYLNPLNLDATTNQAKTELVKAGQVKTGQVKTSVEHSELAMRAAKRMRRTRHKAKTGHTVCHHLLQMINESVDQPAPRPARRYHGLKHNPQVGTQQIALPELDTVPRDWVPANDRQFSLAF